MLALGDGGKVVARLKSSATRPSRNAPKRACRAAGDRAIGELRAAVDLVANGDAGVARVRVVGVTWTWAVARTIQAYARQRGASVRVIDEGDDGMATIQITLTSPETAE